MYLLAVRGKLMVENKRSDIAKLMTNIVVAWHLSFGHLSNATTVNRFPPIPTTVNMDAQIAAKTVALLG
jgi:hypothetical protein